jgi:hypothetical protein
MYVGDLGAASGNQTWWLNMKTESTEHVLPRVPMLYSLITFDRKIVRINGHAYGGFCHWRVYQYIK